MSGSRGEKRRFSTIEHAWNFVGYGTTNLASVKRMVDGFGPVQITVVSSKSYITIARPGHRMNLHVHTGYTTGFSSAEDAESANMPKVWKSARGWGVDHEHIVPRPKPGAKNRTVKGICPTHHQTLNMLGECDYCD